LFDKFWSVDLNLLSQWPTLLIFSGIAFFKNKVQSFLTCSFAPLAGWVKHFFPVVAVVGSMFVCFVVFVETVFSSFLLMRMTLATSSRLVSVGTCCIFGLAWYVLLCASNVLLYIVPFSGLPVPSWLSQTSQPSKHKMNYKTTEQQRLWKLWFHSKISQSLLWNHGVNENKNWLFRVYRGLYYPIIMWGI